MRLADETGGDAPSPSERGNDGPRPPGQAAVPDSEPRAGVRKILFDADAAVQADEVGHTGAQDSASGPDSATPNRLDPPELIAGATPPPVALALFDSSEDGRPLITTRRRETKVAVGQTVGRYVVLRRLAVGGMGAVYAAYDPELDRKVALKVLRVRNRKHRAAIVRETARLVRESRAMAKVSHPNVVAVFDVGTFEASVFIAMELVEGMTLRAWLKKATRTWREIVDVMVPAGRGLDAAHKAGLVHRDVKPSNVLVGDDGRVYVTDFGLARSTLDGAGSPVSVSPDPDEGVIVGNRFETSEQVTGDGLIVGTPAFMAPEQAFGKPTDARTDQFGFCATLYHALYGELPYPKSKKQQTPDYSRLRDAPANSGVPAWLRKVVLRGLSIDPGERHESMSALFDRLTSDPSRMWRSRILVASGLIMLVLSTWGYARGIDPPTGCDTEDPRLADVWGPSRREQARQAFAALDNSFASATWTRIDDRMASFTDGWGKARHQACVATQSGHQSAITLDRRMWCLERALDQADGIAAVFAEADIKVATRAVSTLGGLPPIADCANVEKLLEASGPPEDPQTRDAVAAARAQLANGNALIVVGRYTAAMAFAREALAGAEAINYAPLMARAHLLMGRLHVQQGEPELAADQLHEALFAAERAQLDGVRADVLLQLVHVALGMELDTDAGRTWAELASAVLERRGSPEPQRRATQFERQSELEMRLGNYELALEFELKALDVRKAIEPPDSSMAANYHNIGAIYSQMGDEVAAIDYTQRALAQVEDKFGPEHPNAAHILSSLARSHTILGQHEEAIALLEHALAVDIAALGDTHPKTAQVRATIAFSLSSVSRFAEARAMLLRAEKDTRAVVGPNDPWLKNMEYTHGWISQGQGRFEEALGYFQRAKANAIEIYGADNAAVSAHIDGIAEALVALNRPHEAIEQYELAIALVKTTAPDSFKMGYHLKGLGTAQLRSGMLEDAVGNLEVALKMLEKHSKDTRALGRTRAALAEALWDMPGKRERALGLAEQAQAELSFDHARKRKDLTTTLDWLDAHAP